MQYNTILYLFQSRTRLLTSIFILTQRKGRQHGGFPCVCLSLTPASKAGGFSYEPTHSFSSTAPEELGFHSMQENVEKIPMLVSEQELIDMLFSLAATNALPEALSSRIKRLFRAKQEYLSFHLLFQEHDLRNYCVNPQKFFKIFLQSYTGYPGTMMTESFTLAWSSSFWRNQRSINKKQARAGAEAPVLAVPQHLAVLIHSTHHINRS